MSSIGPSFNHLGRPRICEKYLERSNKHVKRNANSIFRDTERSLDDIPVAPAVPTAIAASNHASKSWISAQQM